MSLTNPVGRFLPVVTILSLLVVAQPARAASLEGEEKAAKKACISGDYAKGVEILSDLYVETNNLTYVFNQGRCFEQNGRYQDAINRFLEYARKLKDTGQAVDPEVERHIADCQAMLDKQTGQPAGAQPVQPRAPAPAPVVPTTLPAPETKAAELAPAPGAVSPQAEVAQVAPAAGTPGAGLRIAGIAAVGLGVAGLATGVILNVKANNLADEIDRSDTSYSRNKESTRSSYETWGWVSYGVGTACAVGGAALYFIGRSQGHAGQMAFVPAAGPGQLGAALQGAF